MAMALHRIMAGGPLRGLDRAPTVLTPHERRIIAEALAAGRVTVCRPGVAAGLSEIERRFGAGRADDGTIQGQMAARDSNLRAWRAMRTRARLNSEGAS